MSSGKSPSQRKAAPRQTTEQPASTSQKSGKSGSQSGKQGSKPATKQTGKTAQPTHKKRGTMLTVALALILVDAILTAVMLISYRKDNIDSTQLPIFLGLAVLFGIAGVVGAAGMWFWKRWAVYLYLVSVAGAVAVGLVIFRTQYAAFHAVIPLLLLGAGLSTKNSIRDFN